MIEIKNLYLKYIREYYALYDINLKVNAGESVALVGDEGSGKTTLLRVLAKLEKYDAGEVYMKEINLKKIDFKTDINLGYISQNPVFFENKSVYANLKYPLEERHIKEAEIEEKVNSALIEFSLERYRNQKAFELSQFEKFVISIVRLSLRHLEVVMIDNIFKNFDEEQNAYVLELIKKLFIDKNVTTLVATNDEKLLCGLCKRVVKFKNGSIEE